MAIWLIGLSTSVAAYAAPVTWNFYVTSCVTDYGVGCDAVQHYPTLLATLVLSGPDSFGRATLDVGPNSMPVWQGGPFSFTLTGGAGGVSSSALDGLPGHDPVLTGEPATSPAA